MRNSALFLDRDGVVNVDRGYVHRPDQFEFVPGIFPSAGRVKTGVPKQLSALRPLLDYSRWPWRFITSAKRDSSPAK
jgi:hypothetical protein